MNRFSKPYSDETDDDRAERNQALAEWRAERGRDELVEQQLDCPHTKFIGLRCQLCGKQMDAQEFNPATKSKD